MIYIEQTKETIKVDIDYQRGDLPWLLFWQSVDGRPSFKEYGTLEEINKHVNHLEAIGRHPTVYLRVPTILNEISLAKKAIESNEVTKQ
jgi:hypothetical protein